MNRVVIFRFRTLTPFSYASKDELATMGAVFAFRQHQPFVALFGVLALGTRSIRTIFVNIFIIAIGAVAAWLIGRYVLLTNDHG